MDAGELALPGAGDESLPAYFTGVKSVDSKFA